MLMLEIRFGIGYKYIYSLLKVDIVGRVLNGPRWNSNQRHCNRLVKLCSIRFQNFAFDFQLVYFSICLDYCVLLVIIVFFAYFCHCVFFPSTFYHFFSLLTLCYITQDFVIFYSTLFYILLFIMSLCPSQIQESV